MMNSLYQFFVFVFFSYPRIFDFLADDGGIGLFGVVRMWEIQFE